LVEIANRKTVTISTNLGQQGPWVFRHTGLASSSRARGIPESQNLITSPNVEWEEVAPLP